MFGNIVVCVVVALLTSAASAASLFGGALAGDVTTFEAFKAKYGRSYASAVEESKRRAIFNRNLERIADARRRNPLATFGVNEFADRNADDMFAGVAREQDDAATDNTRTTLSLGSYPTAIDWRTKGAVTPVGNQGQCGTIICGFGFAGNVEGVWAAHGFELVPLAVNPAMLCSYPGWNGCSLRATYAYFMNNQSGRVQTAASWPYNDTQCSAMDQCKTDHTYGARITGVVELPHDETAMTFSVAINGPIAVAVNADDWQTYTGGVLTSCSAAYVNHVPVIVGYDDVSTPPYWIIKNSWGTAWGEDGYIRVAKGSNACGITTRPMTVTVL